MSVSSGPIKFRTCTAFTKNRYIHAVCSTLLLGKNYVYGACA
ncbi:hypothetical protein D1AOALGA4SA_6548 [Olavius algarvensis Delta 1 endosymbiont]|nr:hypothetical protein D1AOALGA4SA_6548 [Olavius algarvensis Delta 1 endosymbiont]